MTTSPAPVHAFFVAVCVAALVALWLGGDLGRGVTLTGAIWLVSVHIGGALVLWLTILDPTLDRTDATASFRFYALAVMVILSALMGALLTATATSTAARPHCAIFWSR